MVEWRGSAPFSSQFNDIYYQESGLAESRHVFLDGNDLLQRWQDQKHFVIAELGFGTGLNFLATWDLLQKQGNPPVLHFCSVELYPLPKEEIARAHLLFPDIRNLSEQMIAHYPNSFQQDWHWQVNDNLSLTVLWGDAAGRIGAIPEPADAWYLDGFTPANNPELWTDTVFQKIAAKSKSGTTLATFTVARAVRDHAVKAGFVLEKRKGFGRKRHMLTGHYNG